MKPLLNPERIEQPGQGALAAAEPTKLPSKDEDILETKALRVEIDAVIQKVRQSPYKSAERTLAFRSLQQAVMWLGMHLKELGNPNPYPNSRLPNTTIDPTADNLKL